MYRVCKKLAVKVSNFKHNHRIGSDLMAHYPSNQKLNGETLVNFTVIDYVKDYCKSTFEFCSDNQFVPIENIFGTALLCTYTINDETVRVASSSGQRWTEIQGKQNTSLIYK